MAELVLSPIIELLFAKLASKGVEKIARYAGIHSEVKKWETSLSDIRSLLNDASQKEITSESIKEWLNRLQHLAYDIDDILDVLATEAMQRDLAEHSGSITGKVRKLIPPCCTSFSISIRMPDKLNNISTRLQDLEKEKHTLGLKVINERPRKIQRSYKTSLPDECGIVGREHEKDALLDKLLGVGGEPSNKKFNIVPIVGMGGMGKTTLARLLFNDPKVQTHFDVRAWVCVSDKFDILQISKSIFQSVTRENKDFTDLEVLQVDLNEQLMEKRFLLVLDDVWSENDEDWDDLVRPFHAGSPGSKIIMTTRKEQLLKKLGYGDHLNPLQSLSNDDSLSLFSRHVSGVTYFDSHLRKYGKAIVKKCDGLPLALKALARLLNTRPEEEMWKQLLNSEMWRLQEGDRILPALKLSYHDLSACLKKLFAYCSLFPKNYLFDKEELVQLWMAEGLLHPSTTSNLGSECFEELLSRSFFQYAPNKESLFVVHDLMSDLAMSVAGDYFFRSDNKEQKVVKDALEKYRHMSFVCGRYMAYDKFKAFKGAKNLRTFLALPVGMKEIRGRAYISNRILGDLIHEFPLLRVLCLNYLAVTEVPESIGSLKHLRYLNLCKSRITYLPENVGNLYNLQTLIIFGCDRLSKLPDSFSKLKNLQHFDARDTRLLKKMPLGIGELKNLQTLSKVIIGGDNGIAVTKFKDLKNLQGKMFIEGLEKVENAKHAQELNLSQKRFNVLVLKWSDVSCGSQKGKELREEEVFNVLKPGDANLRKLAVESYGGIKFPNWFGDATFHWLTHVAIVKCKNCTCLPPLERLPSLR